MPTIMNRSFAEHMAKMTGRKCTWPKDIAQFVDGKPVTWKELHRNRTEWQQERLHRKRDWRTAPERRAAYVWVFFCPGMGGFIFRGWWLYIRTLKDGYALDFRGVRREMILDIMRQFPCGMLPMIENLERWKESFAKKHSRPGRFKKQGLALGWVEMNSGHPERFTVFSPSAPAESAPSPDPASGCSE